MELIEALEQGKVIELGVPDKIILSHISKLFIFGDRIFKVYKNDKFFFADMSQFEPRREFFFEDFFWNNAAAPEIYQHLWGVKKEGDAFIMVPFAMGEDFMIEMSVIDDSKTLTKLLLSKTLRTEDVAPFIDALVDTLAVLTIERKDKLTALFERDLAQIMKEDIESLYTWMLDTDPHIPKKESEELKEILFKAVDVEPYFKETKKESLSAAIDGNCDNLLLLNGRPSFIDIMPPMVIWRVVDQYATVSRTIVDIEVLGDKELGAVARAAYATYAKEIPLRAKLVHEIRAAAIQWAYRYMLGQTDAAQKFGAYANAKVAELQTLL